MIASSNIYRIYKKRICEFTIKTEEHGAYSNSEYGVNKAACFKMIDVEICKLI